MKKRENIVIIVILVLMLIAIIGVSYAAFSFSRTGSVPNTITTGSITMTYEESDNVINITGALPTTDKTGKTRTIDGEYFDFTVSSEITGDVNINYEISAKEVGDGTIDGSNIKLYLTKLNDDGTEEALMVPEVYNVEANANDYTGRPSGEMSLYTSSMNSSESNNYRLRMYVDEGYNPQGDGGNLTFTVQINVYGKAGDKYVPETTQDILEDNEVQVEKTNMFNYASNGDMLTDPNEMTTVNNPDFVTNGLYSMEDADGVSYYYRGNVTNNNVQFGEYTEDYYVYSYGGSFFQSLESCKEYNSSCSESNRVKLASAGDKMYWKIVRVNGDGSLRLIYNGISSLPTNHGLTNSYLIGIAPYNLNWNDPKYTGYTYDNGTDGFIKREIETWYENSLGDTIYDSMVIGGRFCSDSSGYQTGNTFGIDYIFSSMIRLAQVYTDYYTSNAPTLICPTTDETYGGSYRLKAGLITADELALAGESFYVTGTGYLSEGTLTLSYWTMTPADLANGYAGTWRERSYLRYDDVGSNNNGIRPVINVITDNGFASGDGTASNPYVIE